MSSVEELSEKISHLERGYRRLWIALVLVVLLVVAWDTLSIFLQGGTKRIKEVQILRILDKDGRLRALLGTKDDGSPGLHFYDEDGICRIRFGTHSRGNGLELLDKKERIQVTLKSVFGGLQGLSLWDSRGEPRVALELQPGGNPWLVLGRQSGSLEVLGDLEISGLVQATALKTVDNNGKAVWKAPEALH